MTKTFPEKNSLTLLKEQDKAESAFLSHPDSEEFHSPQAEKKHSARFRVLRILIVIGIFALLGFFLVRDLNSLSSTKLKVHLGWLSLSALLLLFGLLLEVWVWQKNLRLVGAQLSLKNSFKLYYQANVARYIPGKIWSVVGFIHLGQKANLPASKTVGGLLTGLISSLVSGFLLGALCLLLSGTGELKMGIWLSILLVAAGLAGLHPAVSGFLLKAASRFTKRPLLINRYSFSQVLHLLGWYAIAWLFFSFSFAILVRAFSALSLPGFIYALGVFPISYGIGYLAFFSPGGWGIREGGIALLLSQIVPTYLAVTVALVSRLMFTALEAIFFGIALRTKWEQS